MSNIERKDTLYDIETDIRTIALARKRLAESVQKAHDAGIVLDEATYAVLDRERVQYERPVRQAAVPDEQQERIDDELIYALFGGHTAETGQLGDLERVSDVEASGEKADDAMDYGDVGDDEAAEDDVSYRFDPTQLSSAKGVYMVGDAVFKVGVNKAASKISEEVRGDGSPDS